MPQGLTNEEVRLQEELGNINIVPDKASKTIKQIIKDNVFTYFNAIFMVLAILVIITGSFRNLTFLPVVILNAVMGIIQQVKAKSVLDKLTLLAVSECGVIRNGKETKVPVDRLVLGDVVILEGGQQIPADAVVLDGKLMVNEALLTGEADEIEKTDGSELKSGSFIVSGKCLARLTHVGAESYAAKLMEQAKEIKEKQSEMVRGIDTIVKIAGILVIPIGIALFVQSFFISHLSFQDSILSMVSAVVGMIPEGLYLLVTAALTLSAVRLAKSKVLLHDMRSTETLARVDVLCVDKTGTITDNNMNVTEVFYPQGVDEARANDVLTRYISTVTDMNITMTALKNYFAKTAPLDAVEIIPFSSKTKYSEIDTNSAVYRFGAPEFVLGDEALAKCNDAITTRASAGRRVLVLAGYTGAGFEPLAFVCLENGLRPNVQKTFEYFREQEVEVKVISGDNPLTVSNIAKFAGIENSDKYIDLSTLHTDEEIKAAATEYTIFGRVKPEQKKALIIAIRESGKKVAMTGDGVNDILAMKEADCSIAMGAGSDAAMQAAQVVLLDSDFSRMENIISEGRRDINNITRSAVLFLYKNIFSVLLAVFSIATAIKYPLSPSQISLVSGFNIGIPAFLLALEANFKKQKNRFIRETIIKSLPAAITSFLVIGSVAVFREILRIEYEDVGVAGTVLLAICGFILLSNISKPLNRYRKIVIIGCIAGLFITARLFGWLFDMHSVSPHTTMLCIVLAIALESIIRHLNLLFENFHISLKKKKTKTD